MSESTISTLVYIAFTITLPFILHAISALLGVFFPASHLKHQFLGSVLAARQEKLGQYNGTFAMLYILFLGASTAFFVFLSVQAEEWIQANSPLIKFTASALWMLPAFIAGLSVAGYLSNLLFRLCMSLYTYELYSEYNARSLPFEPKPTARFMHLLVWGCAALFAYFAFNYSMEITPHHEIVIGEWMEFGKKRYSISEVQQLVYHPEMIRKKENKPDTLKPFYEIRFRDGYRWDTDNSLKGTRPDKEVFEYLSQKTKLKIDTLRN